MSKKLYHNIFPVTFNIFELRFKINTAKNSVMHYLLWILNSYFMFREIHIIYSSKCDFQAKIIGLTSIQYQITIIKAMMMMAIMKIMITIIILKIVATTTIMVIIIIIISYISFIIYFVLRSLAFHRKQSNVSQTDSSFSSTTYIYTQFPCLQAIHMMDAELERIYIY